MNHTVMLVQLSLFLCPSDSTNPVPGWAIELPGQHRADVYDLSHTRAAGDLQRTVLGA